MRLVILESPFAGNIARNERYARAAMRDCLKRGEAPFASHLLYTQPGVLSDHVPGERAQGIAAGLAWGARADATVVYTDLGFSRGMVEGIARARQEGRPVEERTIAPVGTIYLAGPIFGRTDEEAKGWRSEAKALLVGHHVRDPMDQDWRGHEDEEDVAFHLVREDLQAIEAADVVIVYALAGASWGTAMEAFYAGHVLRQRGQDTAVVTVAEGRISPWLLNHSTRIVTTVAEACAVAKEHIRW